MSTRISKNPQKWFAEQKDLIMANPDLSAAGRQRQLAEARKRAGEEAKRSAQQAAEARQSAMDSPLRDLKRPTGGHTAESRRLLAEQETALTRPEQALNAFKGAIQSGDYALAHAIGNVALQRVLSPMPGRGSAWAPIIEAWGESDPSIHRSLTELDRVIGEQPTKTQLMAEGMFGSAAHDYDAPARETDDPREDLNDDGRRRFDIRQMHDRMWGRSGTYGYGPSPRPDRGDENGVYRAQMDA